MKGSREEEFKYSDDYDSNSNKCSLANDDTKLHTCTLCSCKSISDGKKLTPGISVSDRYRVCL